MVNAQTAEHLHCDSARFMQMDALLVPVGGDG